MECGICLESRDDKDYTILPCQHKVCNECFPKIIVPKCPFCRTQYANNNNRYYDEIDDEMFEIDLDVFYFSDDSFFESERSRRRVRRRRRNNIRPRPRQITTNTPVNIYILNENNTENIENTENNLVYVNTKTKRVFKNNEKRRNKKNNNWNHRNLQRNLISRSY